MLDFKSELKTSMALLGETPTPSQLDDLERFHNILYEVNSRTNLTRISKADSVHLHFLDSLLAVPIIKRSKNIKLLDIGSGAGFPGIPLKILRPNLEVVLLDSSRKKVEFLSYVIRELNLDKITALHSKAEKLNLKPEYSTAFDYVTTRAITDLTGCTKLASPFLANHGIYLAYLGPNQDHTTEQEEIESSGLKVQDSINNSLPHNLGDRKILIMGKQSGALAKAG